MNLLSVLLQVVVDSTTVITDPLAVATPAVAETTNDMNLWTMATYGGPIMILLAAMFAGAVYLFVERLVTLKKALHEDSNFMDKIKDHIYNSKISSARNLCRSTDTPASRMIDKGISRIGRPSEEITHTIESAGNIEIANLERGLVILASIAGGAPMIGFLGTVTGMVTTFFNMAQTSGGTIELSSLSEGMYQAMVTTIGGLIVGILAYFAYNYLVARVQVVVQNLELKTMEFMDLLNEPSK